MDKAIGAGLRVRLLGPLAVLREAEPLALPASRKARALLAYLALGTRPVGRGQLCELLWEDGSNDPRGELRWCLSRIRRVIGDRVIAREDAVQLDATDLQVDALEVAAAIGEGVQSLPAARQRALVALFQGDLLESLEVEDSPAFGSWLTAQRRRFRGYQTALLEQLASTLPSADALPYLEQWVQLAPFDRNAHERLLRALAQRDRIRDGEAHLQSATALFEAEGLDATPLAQTWRTAKTGTDPVLQAVDSGSGRRASVAVMPFADESPAPAGRGSAADALAHDITTRLAKLRSMFVIAQGSAFALHERRIGPEEAGRMLNVDYVVSGRVRREGPRLSVAVELIETRTAHIVWSELLNQKADDALLVLDEIGNRIVASIAAEIETVERNRAILRPPSSLDAWEAHHRGLWHMYRFTRADNERARGFFEQAVKLDPTFARAHAGLSFTHFQNAFQGWADRRRETERAFEAAGQSLMVDDRDPAAHWAMGRALWLRRQDEPAVQELQRSIELSPNFALAHYTLAFVQAQSGDPAAAIASSDCSRELSPFDPLLFGMLGSRAIALARLGRYDEAAAWAVKGASRPNAHAHIHAIAAYCLALAGSLDEARARAASIGKRSPGYAFADFLEAFRFGDDGATLFRKAARRLGMR